MTEWGNFFVAIVSAAAALTGLIFVGVSISLNRILSVPMLSGRASEPLILLITVLIISALCLVPGQPVMLLGLQISIISAICWAVTLQLDLKMLRNTEIQYKKHYRRNLLFTQCAVIPFIIAGIIISTMGVIGIYWLIPGIIISMIISLMDAWVLLVEIHR